MNRIITKSGIDTSLGVNACKAYEDGNYKKAVENLLQILDMEPENWLARFYIATCYGQLEQKYAALRAFNFIIANCPDEEIRTKSVHLRYQYSLENKSTRDAQPAEFGRFNGLDGVPRIV